ncbi:MAG TPA: acyloxyacyl hydrolase [Flavobacteriales bacterium]|nr:acyloxyacyl hydrolase [Flavobacteriales bacterium]
MTLFLRSYIIICSFICPGVLHAQDTLGVKKINSPEIGVKTQLGYLAIHSTKMIALVEGHATSFELYAEKITTGKKNWHQAYRIPSVGLSAQLMAFGNPVQMGKAFSLIPYMKLHLAKRRHFELNTRLGAGLGYLTKYFDRIENNKNSAIASPLNAAISINLEPEWKTRYIDLGLGISFIHFSNGAFKTPNMGFNIPSLSFSLGYKFNHQQPVENKQKVFNEFQKKNYFDLMAIGGVKEIMPSGGPKYGFGGIHFQYRRHYSVKSNFLAIADVNYNAGYVRAYKNKYKVDVKQASGIRAGIGIGYGLSFDRLCLSIQNGIYLYDQLDYDGIFYHRVAARYYFDNGFIAGFSLDTHFATADVVELGFGYSF